MGHALDEWGQVIGEAFGATKREVFDVLMTREAAGYRVNGLR